MTLLLLLLLSFAQTSGYAEQEHPAVHIRVVRQQKFNNRGHHPENNRRVVFRMENKTGKPVVIYGFRYEDGFDPTGYIIELDKESGEWIYPTSNKLPVKWEERAEEFKEKHVLQSGKVVMFDAEMSEVEVGRRFKRTAYVSNDANGGPLEIRSEEFILK